MPAPKVSVVMSVYNGLPYLHGAIESILSQTFEDFEFIVINDGSTDDTLPVLMAYAEQDGRLQILENVQNLGYTRSLNRGIFLAKGVYIARQDADDVSCPERLERQVEFLDHHPQVGIVGTLPEFIDAEGNTLPILDYQMLTDNDSIQEAILDRNCIRHGSTMFRRDLLDVVGIYDPDLEPAEDYDLWLRLAEISQLANLPEPLYRYREYSDSVSSQRRYVQMFNKSLALERALQRRFGDGPPEDKKSILARDYLRSAVLAHIIHEDGFAHCSLDRALDLDSSILYTTAEECLIRYAPYPSTEHTVLFVEEVFDQLFPRSLKLKRLKSRIISRLHIQQVFMDLQSGELDHLEQHLWRGIRLRPAWLMNRGVLSLAVKTSLNRTLSPVRRTS